MDNNSGKLMDNAENDHNKNVDVYSMYKNKAIENNSLFEVARDLEPRHF